MQPAVMLPTLGAAICGPISFLGQTQAAIVSVCCLAIKSPPLLTALTAGACTHLVVHTMLADDQCGYHFPLHNYAQACVARSLSKLAGAGPHTGRRCGAKRNHGSQCLHDVDRTRGTNYLEVYVKTWRLIIGLNAIHDVDAG